MNVPNTITLSRVFISVAAAVLLCFPFAYAATAAFALFVLAGATDWVDGYVARKYDIVTNLGKFMDALSDKVMVIGMFLVLLGLGLYGPEWTIYAIFCTFFSAAREFFVSGIRMLAATLNIVLAAETMGKYKAAFQMYSIGAVMCAHALSVDFGAEGRLFDALYCLVFYSGIAALGVSTLLSLVSGFGYLRRYGYLLRS